MKKILSILLIAYCLLLVTASPVAAHTPPPFQSPPLVNPEVVTAPGQTTADVATLKGLEALFFNTVVVILALAGIAFFIMLIIGGFKLMTSGADRDKPQAAKNTLTYAFAGFIVVIASFLILRFVEELTGIQTLHIFEITQ